MSKGKKKMKLIASALAIGAGVAAVNAVRKKNYEGGQGDSPKSTEKKGMPEERKEELKQFRNTERGKYEKNSKGIYYTNGNYEAFARPEKPEGVDGKSAYLVGSGLASLAAACFLVRDAQMPGKNIHILEAMDVAGGAFDDIDINLAHHTAIGNEVVIRKGSGNGFVSKVIRYKGKAAHAAGSPHLGVNALNAAAIGLTALQYQRETFQDKDTVRVHPIMTKGGDLVNVIPNEAVIETLVRANNTEAILDASEKTDRAFLAGAVAVGAQVEIETMPGYLPTIPVDAPAELVEAARLAAGDKYNVNVFDGTNKPSGGSTDVGDVQHIQPVFTFNTGGAAGSGLHSVDFDINDEELAYIVTAKIFALTAYRFLKGGAAAARKLVDDYKPVFTKQEYIDFMESMISTKIGGEPHFDTQK